MIKPFAVLICPHHLPKKGVDQDSDMNDAMRMHETERKQHKGVIHTYETTEIQL